MDQRLAMLRALLRNPAADPVLTGLLVAAAALALLVVVLLLLAWASPGAKSRRSAHRPVTAPRGSGRRHGCGWAVVVGLLLLAAAGAAYSVTSGDAYCGTVCHSMQGANGSWLGSSHAEVACARCHEGVPVLSAPSALVSRTRDLLSEAAGGAIRNVSSVPASRCMECHAAIASAVVVAPSGIAMAHGHVLGAGAACDECHGRQGHERRGTGPPMSVCLRCHDSRTARVDCSVCHRKPAEGLVTPRAESLAKVTLPADPTCGGCHDEKPCDACHGLRMPHPADYRDPRKHARAAAFEGKDRLCYRCHTFEDCGECHKPFSEHGPDWKRRHAEFERDSATCTRCHDTRGLCGVCHP